MTETKQIEELKQDAMQGVSKEAHVPGVSVFKVSDFFKTQNMLSRLLCGIVIKEGITMSLIESCLRMSIIADGRKLTELSQDKGNLIKAISGESVSFNKVVQFLMTILGYDMDIQITLTKNGIKRAYSYSEIAREMFLLQKSESTGGAAN